MDRLVFVYGTLLRGEVNHGLLADAKLLGPHRTEPRFTLYRLGAYPGLAAGGGTAVHGEVYRVTDAGLRVLDQLEDYPRLYDRELIPTPYGRAWVYVYRGRLRDREPIRSGDWRSVSQRAAPVRAAAVRNRRDPKNPRRQALLRSARAGEG
jgi:gamma-glutamylcyclotransferase (GGCT)/AIG2-like uncharacterized protein YtfP